MLFRILATGAGLPLSKFYQTLPILTMLTGHSYYINAPGVGTDEACVWGSNTSPVGNWSPYVAGANTDANGNTFVKLGWNPVYLEAATPFRNTMPSWGAEIVCSGSGCNGLPCAIDPSKNGVNEMIGSSTDGAGGGAFCVVTVPKGVTANIEIFDNGGSSSGSSSPAPSSSSQATTWSAPSSSSQIPSSTSIAHSPSSRVSTPASTTSLAKWTPSAIAFYVPTANATSSTVTPLAFSYPPIANATSTYAASSAGAVTESPSSTAKVTPAQMTGSASSLYLPITSIAISTLLYISVTMCFG